MNDALTTGLRRRVHRLTLLQRFLLLEVGIFAVIFGGVLFFVAEYSVVLRERIDHERLLVTRSFADQIDGFFDDSVAELLDVAHLLGRSDLPDLAVAVAGRGGRFDRGMLVVDLDRDALTVLRSAPQLEEIPEGSLVDGMPGALVFADGARVWGAQLQPDHAPVVAIAVPVGGSATGSSEGTYVVGLVDAISSNLALILTKATEVGETGHADLVDRRGIALLSTESEHLLRTSDHPALYRRQLLLPEAGVFLAPHDEEGSVEDHAMGFVHLGTVPLGFALGGEADETYEPIETLWFAFFGLAAVLGVFAFTLTVMGVDRLVRPVEQLSRAAHRVASGELEVPIAISGGGEIGELAGSVERMRASLYEWGTELDNRVHERTAEVERRSRYLAASAAVAQAAGSTLDTKQLLEVVADRIEGSLGIAGAIVVTREEVGLPAVSHLGAQARQRFGQLEATRCGECLRQIMAIDSGADTGAAAAVRECTQIADRSGLRSTLVPLRSRDRGEGMLCVLQDPDAGEQVDRGVLELLGAQVAIGLHNARLYGSLHEREAQRRILLAKVLTAQEEERQRLARELHDGAAQSLAAVLLTLDSIAQVGEGEWTETAARIEQTRELSVDALNELRMMIFALRPPVLDDLGLVAALRRYAERMSGSSEIRIRIEDGLHGRRLLPDAEVTVFRIIQEALNNVIRHSEARESVVQIELAGGVLRAEVRDNGRGFGVPTTHSPLGGFGLGGMAERARLLGGVLTVDSQPGRGTTVQLAVAEALVAEEENPEVDVNVS